MKKTLIWLGIIAVLAVGAWLLLSMASPEIPEAPVEGQPVVEAYSSEAYGIAFEYPAEYVLTESEQGNGERAHYAIVLVEPQDVEVPENGEGPTAITVNIYQNNLDDLSLMEWVTGSSFSNYKLGPMTHASTSVDGVEAVQYSWDGLYTGETTAFLYEGNVIAVSVTYFTPTDAKVVAYRALLGSIELQ